MRAQRRTSFAAPFVMVVGCGSAAVPPAPPPLRPEPVDASTAQAPRCFSGNVVCEGAKCAPSGRDGGVILPVSLVSIVTNGLGIIVSTPPDVSVKDWWKGVFVDDNDQPIPGSELVYIMPFDSGFAAEVKALCDLPSKRVSVWPPKDYVPPKPFVSRPTQNPPRPQKPDCCVNPPPPGHDARIIGLRVESGGTVITLGIGSAKGVSQESKITVGHVDCTDVIVNERFTTCSVKLTPDQLKSAGNARIEPR